MAQFLGLALSRHTSEPQKVGIWVGDELCNLLLLFGLSAEMLGLQVAPWNARAPDTASNG